MIKSSRLCRIMIKDIKTKISELNIDFDYEAYWEIIYLILLAFFVGMRFLLSTMFTIYWPKYFYRTLTVIGVVLVLMHLMLAKDIKKKEILAMLVVTFVFMMSHYVSRYDFLVDLLILILGAYRVNFRNILKTYIAVWSVLLVVTIIGTMTGLAENLVYYQQVENGMRVRMALGICYPTDLAAYVVFLMFAYATIRNKEITSLEIFIMIAMAFIVFYITDARTDFVVMLLLDIMLFICKSFEKYVNRIFQKKQIKYIIYFIPIFICALSWMFTLLYNEQNEFMVKLDNSFLSTRLSLGKQVIDNYSTSVFGKYIYEKGFGGSTESFDGYTFLDCSYISIGMKYGIVFLILVLFVIIYLLKKFYYENELMLIVLLLLLIQSMMEHHLIQYWYNPFLVLIFAKIKFESYYTGKKDIVIDLNK